MKNKIDIYLDKLYNLRNEKSLFGNFYMDSIIDLFEQIQKNKQYNNLDLNDMFIIIDSMLEEFKN